MSEENKNTITYEDNWKSVSATEYPTVYPTSEISTKNQAPEKKKKDKDSPKQLLITIQLIICIIIALAAFILKGIGGEVYAAASEWYYSELNDSAIFENIDRINLSGLFATSTDDEA